MEVSNLYYWSKTNPCATTYQCLVDRGKGTSCIDIPDVWPDLNELWSEGTSCNKHLVYKILYSDGSYIKFHYDKPIVCGILIDDRVYDHMLTTLYGLNQTQADWCKSMTMWLDKDPKFITYRVRTPAFYPNAHMYEYEELTDSYETDLVRTLKAPP